MHPHSNSVTHISWSFFCTGDVVEDEGVTVVFSGSAWFTHTFEQLPHGRVLLASDEPLSSSHIDSLSLQLEVLKERETTSIFSSFNWEKDHISNLILHFAQFLLLLAVYTKIIKLIIVLSQLDWCLLPILMLAKYFKDFCTQKNCCVCSLEFWPKAVLISDMNKPVWLCKQCRTLLLCFFLQASPAKTHKTLSWFYVTTMYNYITYKTSSNKIFFIIFSYIHIHKHTLSALWQLLYTFFLN